MNRNMKPNTGRSTTSWLPDRELSHDTATNVYQHRMAFHSRNLRELRNHLLRAHGIPEIPAMKGFEREVAMRRHEDEHR